MTRTPRVAFDARYVNDRYHGIGRYAFRLVEALVIAGRDYHFTIFTGRGHNSRFSWETVREHSNVELLSGPWPLYWPQEQLLWPVALREQRIELFHSPYFPLPLLGRVPGIMTVHDLIFDRSPAFMPRRWMRPYYRLMLALGLRQAQKIVAVSRFTACDLASFYAIPPERIQVIAEGVDPHFSARPDLPSQDLLRQRYGLKRPFLLTVGARRPHKNLSRLVQAYGRLAGRVNHDLVFAGPADPHFPDTARQLAHALGLNGRIRFLDWVPEADLPGLYAMSDLVVLPSEVEGFGLPALESMACGTPVLAADNSAFPEVIGDAGILVNPFDEAGLAKAIEGLLADKALRGQLAEAGLKRSADFRWEAIAGQVLSLYQEILG